MSDELLRTLEILESAPGHKIELKPGKDDLLIRNMIVAKAHKYARGGQLFDVYQFVATGAGLEALWSEKERRAKAAAEEAERKKDKAEEKQEKKKDRILNLVIFLLGFLAGFLTDAMKEQLFAWLRSLFH